MQCLACHEDLGPRARAAISVLAGGDEVIFSYWYCPTCEKYTVDAWHDRFIGNDSSHYLPLLGKEEGDRAVALIAACPTPFDKHCGCRSHQALYTGRPR